MEKYFVSTFPFLRNAWLGAKLAWAFSQTSSLLCTLSSSRRESDGRRSSSGGAVGDDGDGGCVASKPVSLVHGTPSTTDHRDDCRLSEVVWFHTCSGWKLSCWLRFTPKKVADSVIQSHFFCGWGSVSSNVRGCFFPFFPIGLLLGAMMVFRLPAKDMWHSFVCLEVITKRRVAIWPRFFRWWMKASTWTWSVRASRIIWPKVSRNIQAAWRLMT